MAAEKKKTTATKEVTEQSALEKLAKELAAVAETDFLPITTDIVSVVATSRGIKPKLDAMQERIRALPEHRQEVVEKFSLYTSALWEAHSDYVRATRPADGLAELADRCTEVRDRFYADVQALIARQLINAEEVRVVRTGIGYKPLALDLTVLTDTVKEQWEVLKSHTGIKWEEVQEAEKLADALLQAVGEKEQAPAKIAEASAQRSRAWALYLRSYNEVRRVVTYLQWNDGDIDQIVPSLYPGRGGSKKKEVPTETPDDGINVTPPVVTAPVVTPVPAPAKTATGPDSDPFGRS